MNNQQILTEILRVNHAGEFGAVQICKGQAKALPGDETINEIYAQEQQHYQYFTQKMVEAQISPTIFKPLWAVLGYGLGFISAKVNNQLTHACTVAIEEVIVEHYQKQLELLNDFEPSDEINQLKNIIQQFMLEEKMHKDMAATQSIPSHNTVVHKMIKKFSKLAIMISKKI